MTHNGHRTMWTFAITSIALFMTTLDNLVVTMALPTIQRDLHASISGLEWTVNAYTLTFAVLLLMGAALGDRFGRKRMFLIGIVDLHRRIGGGRAGADDRLADRRPRGAGRRWRDRHPAHPDAPDAGRPARAARARAGRMGRYQRPWRRPGPARRRRRRAGHLVAVDLLAERPAGPVGAAHGIRPAAREPRAVAAARSARSGDRHRRRVRNRVGAGAREPAGLDEPRDRRLAGHGRAPAGGVRRLGAAHLRSDAADAVLREPHLRDGERCVAPDVLRHVRLDLPAQRSTCRPCRATRRFRPASARCRGRGCR